MTAINTTTAALSGTNICKTYGKQTVLNNLDINIEAGCKHCRRKALGGIK